MKYIDIVRKNECKDRFCNLYNESESMLITKNKGFEVLRISMPKGNKGVMPPLADHITEVYYILEGCLSFIYKNQEEFLYKGDTFVLRTYPKAIPYIVHEDLTMILSTNHLEFNKHKEILDLLQEQMDLLENSDLHSRSHCERLEKLLYPVIKYIHLEAYRAENLIYAACYHDVGKIKNGQMNELIDHPSHGAQLVLPYLGEDVAQIILQHHENVDGSGFPNGLQGDEIILEAKILAVVNKYDYLIHDHQLSQIEAIDYLKVNVGKQFDKNAVDVFIQSLGVR